MPVYHPNSNYGKLLKLLDSTQCICNIRVKVNGKPFCYNCFSKLKIESPSITYNLSTKSGEKLLEAYEDALEALDFKIRDIK